MHAHSLLNLQNNSFTCLQNVSEIVSETIEQDQTQLTYMKIIKGNALTT